MVTVKGTQNLQAQLLAARTERLCSHPCGAQWERLTAALGSIIGERGVELLLSRSIHEVQRHYAWLGTDLDSGTHTVLDQLMINFSGQTAAIAEAASAALLARLSATLSTLIGSQLASSILLDAVGPGDADKQAAPEPDHE